MDEVIMEELLNWMKYIEDVRQKRKVRHRLKDILVIVLFATLANADNWVKMEIFTREYQDYLHRYIGLENGIPSHDTLNRVRGYCPRMPCSNCMGSGRTF